MQLRNIKLGTYVRIKYEDSDLVDGILVEKDHRNDPAPRMCKVFFPCSHLDTTVEASQIVKVGKVVAIPNDSGLD